MEGQNQGAEATPDFTKADTWEDVMTVLDTVEGVQGSKQFYPVDMIHEQMSTYAARLAEGNEDLAADELAQITGTGGLRGAVERAVQKRIENAKK